MRCLKCLQGLTKSHEPVRDGSPSFCPFSLQTHYWPGAKHRGFSSCLGVLLCDFGHLHNCSVPKFFHLENEDETVLSLLVAVMQIK